MALALFTFFAIFLPTDLLAAAVRSGSTANGILRMLGDESRSVVRRRGGGEWRRRGQSLLGASPNKVGGILPLCLDTVEE